EGSFSSDYLFSKYYASEDYSLSYWDNQFNDKVHFRVEPASHFHRIRLSNSIGQAEHLIPVIVRNVNNDPFLIVAMLVADRMKQCFYDDDESSFSIYGNLADRPLFHAYGAESESCDFIANHPFSTVIGAT